MSHKTLSTIGNFFLGTSIILAFLLMVLIDVPEYMVPVPTKTECKDTVIVQYEMLNVGVTTYFATPEQCDNNHLITADGSEIDSTSINWCAVSQDLLDYFDYGDTIYISVGDTLYDGYYEIHDCMNPRVRNYIDILIPPGSTKRGGLWKGTIQWKYQGR